jgi:hypothetical protein
VNKVWCLRKIINTNFIEKKQYLCHREFAEHTFAISALSNLCAIWKEGFGNVL